MSTQVPISGVFFKHASLRGLLHHQVRSRPDDIAVTAAGGDRTFRELKAEADRLGSHLADRLDRLVPRGTIVVIAADAPEAGDPLRPDDTQAHHLAPRVPRRPGRYPPPSYTGRSAGIIDRVRRPVAGQHVALCCHPRCRAPKPPRSVDIARTGSVAGMPAV